MRLPNASPMDVLKKRRKIEHYNETSCKKKVRDENNATPLYYAAKKTAQTLQNFYRNAVQKLKQEMKTMPGLFTRLYKKTAKKLQNFYWNRVLKWKQGM